MLKDDLLNHWRALTETPLRPRAIPYRHKGSTYERGPEAKRFNALASAFRRRREAPIRRAA